MRPANESMRAIGRRQFSTAPPMLAALVATALVPHLACATLGQPESTIADDVRQLKASITSAERTNYRVHEIRLPSGTVLREFAAIGGNVFAVTWRGPAMPDLRQTLGSYFAAYATAARSPQAGRTHLQVRQPDLVIQSSGHMRAFTGRAYLPEGVPSTVSVDELR